MELDPAAARRLRTSSRRACVLAAGGVLLVGGFIAAALIDPDAMAPATKTDPSAGWLAWTTVVLTVGVALLIAAVVGFVRLRRQQRTLARAAFVRLPAQWAPMRVRRQSVPGIAVEEPDGSWLTLELPALLRTQRFETSVRAAAAVEIARAGRRAVVRAPGSTALLSAKPKQVVAEPPPDPSAPLVTLWAGALIAIDPGETSVWFREKTRNALDTDTALTWSFLGFVGVAVIVQTAFKGDLASVGGALFAVYLLAVASVGPVLWLSSQTETTVGRVGVTRKRLGREPTTVAFARISTVARHVSPKSSRPTAVVMRLDDDSTVTIQTRRPGVFVAALQRGRDFI